MNGRFSLPKGTVLDGSYCVERVIGSGGFGITYEAADTRLGTRVAIKEYYPEEFGSRESSLDVRPKSERQRPTFDWGRSSFLQEARTLARFRHPSIVQVTRVFEAYSTAYMVMVFEPGGRLEAWLKHLERAPTQQELDRVSAPLLDALELMHEQDFLHRDIAPDNIVIRPDGSPVLLDFGAARRAVAEVSRSLTGVVKSGYSPPEQYAADGRLQGPWTDVYAFGATLYRAISGRVPEESTLRTIDDRLVAAARIGEGRYRPGFLSAIDACLSISHEDRPQSVDHLRTRLFASVPNAAKPARGTDTKPLANLSARQSKRLPWALAAVVVAVLSRLAAAAGARTAQAIADAEETRKRAEEEILAKARELETRRKAEEEARRREEQRAAVAREAAERTAREEVEKVAREEVERKRLAEERIAEARAAEERARRETEATREAEAARESAEADRTATEIAARQAAEAQHIAAGSLSIEDRASFVRRVQEVLKASRCSDGAINGSSSEAQKGVDRFVEAAHKKGKDKPAGMELAKANANDFETWLRDANTVQSNLCFTPAPKPQRKVTVTKGSEPAPAVRRPYRAEDDNSSKSGGEGRVKCWSGRTAASAIGCRNGTQ